MNAPGAPCWSQFLHQCGINEPQRKAGHRPGQCGLFFQQPATERMEPVLAFAQTLEQRHIREVGQLGLPRSHGCLAQRITAGQMEQQDAQTRPCVFILAQTLESMCLTRQLLPPARHHREQEGPIFVHDTGFIHS